VLDPLPQPCELPVLLPLPVPPLDVAPDEDEPLMLSPELPLVPVELHAARPRAIRPPMRMP
jgi:hypothetical protein